MLLKLDVYSISRFNLVPHDSNVAVDTQVWFRFSKWISSFAGISKILCKSEVASATRTYERTISERFRQFCFFTKRSTLLLENSTKINFLHLLIIEQHAKLLPYLLILVD